MSLPDTDKALYYGDNLEILRTFPDESVDLIYLDPPFNSKADYNVIFRDHTKGNAPSAQIKAFEDTWHWGVDSDEALDEIVQKHGRLGEFLHLLVTNLGKNDLSAYLVMMAVRLVHLHRVLKRTGSLYLHCDPTASHYLKAILDIIFGPKNFRNEIIWKRTSAHNDPKRWGRVHDTILFYTKSDEYVWNPVYQPYDPEYLSDKYRYQDERGVYRLDNLTAPLRQEARRFEWQGFVPPPGREWRFSREELDRLLQEGRIYFPERGKGGKKGFPSFKHYLDPEKGVPVQDVITDIPPVNSQAKERLGYPTQKPLALLERIIQASSNPGDLVMDPFCGCGTAIAAAEKLGRRWIGIDITHLAVALIQARLKRDFNLEPDRDYQVIGTPKDVEAARFLFQKDPFQFQFWVVGLLGGAPDQKKGKDRGVDGMIYYRTPGGEQLEKAVISVKGGDRLNPGMVRDLRGTVEREKAQFGILVTLADPTRGMVEEAEKSGTHKYGSTHYPKIQILTVKEILEGKRPLLPMGAANVTLERKEVRTAEKEASRKGQTPLF